MTETGQACYLFDEAMEEILVEDLAVSVSGNPAETFEGTVLYSFVVAARLRSLRNAGLFSAPDTAAKLRLCKTLARWVWPSNRRVYEASC